MDPKNTNNLDDLVYKTMPTGKQSVAPQIVPQIVPDKAPVAPAPAPAPSAPGLNQVAGIAGGSSPASGSSAIPTPAPAPAPLSSEPDHSFDLHPSEPDPKAKWKKIGMISLAVILFIAAGAYAYFGYFKKAPVSENTAPLIVPAPVVQSKITDEWRTKFFNSAKCTDQTTCGDDADPDHDGLSNLLEFQALTDPNNNDSDKDGLADGDEVNVFGYDPQNASTSGDPKYTDADDAKSKWNSKQKRAFSNDELTAIAASIKKSGLHNPTIATLGQDMVDFYTNFGGGADTSASAPAAGTDTSTDTSGSASADTTTGLDRDTQRADSIKKIGFALLDYKTANLKFPNVTTFDAMITAIKPLISTKAINTTDPKNVAPYVYSYTAVSAGADFKLGYYSETQKQAIVLTSKEVVAMYNKDQANQRDAQRKADLEQLSTALEVYSQNNNADSNPGASVFPAEATWKADLSPNYIATIPVDPQTKKDYTYTATPNRDSYALQAILEVPPTGKKGYLCTADGCVYY